MTQRYRKVLRSGSLTISQSGDPTPLEDLFDIAERQNPKRAFLFVSKLLGRHIPIPPRTMRHAFRQLASQIPANLPEPILCIGMAETAVGLAAGVHQEICARYHQPTLITSTRHPVDGELLCEFKEKHSHATDHLLYWPADETIRKNVADAKTLILIDDEATTGATFLNLLQALRDAGLNQFQHLVTVTLTDWSDDALATIAPLPTTNVSLAHGKWHWHPDPEATPPVMPDVNVTARGTARIVGKQNWGRLGLNKSTLELGNDIHTHAGERVLVLGTSEFVWQPFLLAEKLESQGASVLYGSTTRSPIALGHAIASVISFADNYGLGIPNYVYNVAHQSFDRVLLCCETLADTVDTQLIVQLKTIAPIVEIVVYE